MHARLRRRNPSPDKTQGRGGWVTERLRPPATERLAGGRGEHNEGTSETQHKKGRADVHHWDEIGRYTYLPNISRLHSLFVADLQRLEPRDWLGSRPSERRLAGVSALTSHASSGRSPAQPPLVRPLSRED